MLFLLFPVWIQTIALLWCYNIRMYLFLLAQVIVGSVSLSRKKKTARRSGKKIFKKLSFIHAGFLWSSLSKWDLSSPAASGGSVAEAVSISAAARTGGAPEADECDPVGGTRVASPCSPIPCSWPFRVSSVRHRRGTSPASSPTKCLVELRRESSSTPAPLMSQDTFSPQN